MPYQKYKDISLVFGPPSGERYEMLSSIANQAQRPFSEIYLEFLSDVLSKKGDEGLLEDALSNFIEQEIYVGEYTLTYLYWYRERAELSKFVSNSQFTDQKSLLPIKILVLMLYPDKFVVRSTGKLIRKNIELDHFERVASILEQVLKLDWIRTIGAFSEDDLCI